MDKLNGYNSYPPEGVSGSVDAAIAELRNHKFDSIAVRGVSGIMVGAPVAYILRKPLLVVRKRDEMQSAHTSVMTSNYDNAGNSYIIIDDQIDTGRTFAAIIAQLKNDVSDCKCTGYYLYSHNTGWHTADTLPMAAKAVL